MIRFLLVVPTLALLGAAPPAKPPGPQTQPTRVISPVPAVCGPIGSIAEGDPNLPRPKRLGDLPPAQTYMAVYRTDERGCLDPMLASERQGIRAPR